MGLVASEYAAIDRSNIEPASILTVGRLEEKKGHRYLLEAVAILKEAFPGIRYRIAGEGSLSNGLKAYAAELGIAERCEFLGVCSRNNFVQHTLYEVIRFRLSPMDVY